VVILLIYRRTSKPAPREMEKTNKRSESAQPKKKTRKLSVQVEKTGKLLVCQALIYGSGGRLPEETLVSSSQRLVLCY
jgi:hypothetical protein